MRAEQRGIILSRAELTALLAFAATDEKRQPQKCVIHFSTLDQRLRAYAADGTRAIEADSAFNDQAPAGEWSIDRRFLEQARKLATADDLIVLEVSGASLHTARIEDEAGGEISTIAWPVDAASSQATLPLDDFRQIIKLDPSDVATKCVTVNSSQLASLAVIGKAANWDAVDLYQPATRAEPLRFRFDSVGSTWTGVLMPQKSEADYEPDGWLRPSDFAAAAEEDEPQPKRKPRKQPLLLPDASESVVTPRARKARGKNNEAEA